MFSPRKSKAAIRVVTYNLLSPNLATPLSYPTLNAENLDPNRRLDTILNKLEQEMSHKRVVLCLQEVSYDWAGSLHTFFSNRGYHMVTGLYGKQFNGYMGVAMAWPTSSFETLNVDISRLSDKRIGGWPQEDPFLEEEEAKPYKNDKPCFNLFSWLLPWRKTSDERPPLDPWDYSKKRFNVLLTATLREKDTDKCFCIGNYHMPCAFYAPQVMTIHSEMAAHHVQSLARRHCIEYNEDCDSVTSLPYIVAGDWNIKPRDAAYNLLTTGTLSIEDPAYPEPAMSARKANQVLMTWEPRISAMRSAYADWKQGQEPDFTNYAAPRCTYEEGGEDFVDTLDYIFLSPEWKVLEISEIATRDQVKGPFPNLADGVKEPSDHVLLAARLELE